jgi:hypothetical protein
MVIDGEVDEEDFTADVVAEALDDAFDARDFPTAANMATLRATVTPRIDTRGPQAFGSLLSPPAAPSRANSPSVSNNAESVSLTPVASSPHDVVGVDVVADSLRVALAVAVDGSSLHASLTTTLNLHLVSNVKEGNKAATSVSRVEERVAKALHCRLVSSSDDDDGMNDTPAEAAKRNLIRRRKNLRLI